MKSLYYSQLKFSYKKIGNGRQTFIAFHGHGKNHKDFEIFTSVLDATIYSFDLFGHGNSTIPQNRVSDNPLKIKEIQFFIEQFMLEEQINDFSLIGYSLGGKIAIQVFILFPQCINKIILLAPDGFKKIGWYTKTSQSKILNWVYLKTVRKPNFFINVVKIIRFLKLIPISLYKFLNYHFETEERRKMAYLTWSFYRNIFPNQKLFAEKCNQYNVKLIVITGKYDKVIRTDFIDEFKVKFYPKLKLKELKIGHDFFNENNLKVVLSFFNQDLEKLDY